MNHFSDQTVEVPQGIQNMLCIQNLTPECVTARTRPNSQDCQNHPSGASTALQGATVSAEDRVHWQVMLGELGKDAAMGNSLQMQLGQGENPQFFFGFPWRHGAKFTNQTW